MNADAASERDFSNDDGATLVTVITIMLVLTIGALAVAALAMNTTTTLRGSQDYASAQATVDAAIAEQTVGLETRGACVNTTGNGSVDGGNGEIPYSYTLDCRNGTATLTASATVNRAASQRQAVFGYTAASAPPTAGGPGIFYTYGMNSRMNSYVFDEANSEVSIEDFAGAAGVYATRGNIACGWGSTFPGDIYTKEGDLQLDSGCEVEGNAYIGGRAFVNGGTIEGSLIAPKNVNHTVSGIVGDASERTGDLKTGGTITLNSGTVHGNVSAAGTGNNTIGSGKIHGSFAYRGSYSVWGLPILNIVAGLLFKDTSLQPPELPEIPEWQNVEFAPVNATTPPEAWAREGYSLTTVAGAGCDKWSGNGADVTSVASGLSGRMIFDIRACSGGFDTNSGGANKHVRINQDIAIIANHWYLSGTKFSSADGAEHTVFLITPDSAPNTPGPQCSSPAKGSEQVNDSKVDPKIAVYIYTPCKMKFNAGNATFRGQVYSGELEFGGGVQVAFAPRNIPGYKFDEDIENDGSGGTGGSGTGSTSFTLLSAQDVGSR